MRGSTRAAARSIEPEAAADVLNPARQTTEPRPIEHIAAVLGLAAGSVVVGAALRAISEVFRQQALAGVSPLLGGNTFGVPFVVCAAIVVGVSVAVALRWIGIEGWIAGGIAAAAAPVVIALAFFLLSESVVFFGALLRPGAVESSPDPQSQVPLVISFLRVAVVLVATPAVILLAGFLFARWFVPFTRATLIEGFATGFVVFWMGLAATSRFSPTPGGIRLIWLAVSFAMPLAVVSFVAARRMQRSARRLAVCLAALPVGLSVGFVATSLLVQVVAADVEGRIGFAATSLSDGRVLVTGGTMSSSIDPTFLADIYDPTTGKWSSAGPMRVARAFHTATLMSDGMVLVTGGDTSAAELFDPSMGTWVPIPGMSIKRSAQAAVALDDERVLVAGGTADQSAEIFDQRTRSWSRTGPMNADRSTFGGSGFNLVRLADGKVLAIGGTSDYRSMEEYDPAADTWTPVDGPSVPVSAAALLPDGRVFALSGGAGKLYDPNTGEWTDAALNPGQAASAVAMAQLSDGSIILAGGIDANNAAMADAWIYQPASGMWSSAGKMGLKRFFAALVGLPGGDALVVGGYSPGTGAAIAAAERYSAAAGSWSPAGRMGG